MVESNHDEERLARIEHMVEDLQRESDALKVVTAKLLVAVTLRTPAVPVVSGRPTPRHRCGSSPIRGR
jgi:hypothetical protein